MPEQLGYAPAVIGDPSGHGRCSANAILGQAGVKGAEVVHRTHQVHPGMQQRLSPQQGPCAPHQGGQPGAEGAIQPLAVGGVQHTASLRPLQQLAQGAGRPLRQAPRHGDYPPAAIAFDHLADDQAGPGNQAWPTALAVALGRAKSAAKALQIGDQSVGDQEQCPRQGTSPNDRHNLPNQRGVPRGADHSAQPQPRRDHEGHGQPDHVPLEPGADLVGLHLPQVAGLDDLALVHLFAVLSGGLDPLLDGAGLKAEPGFDRLRRSAVRRQGQHLGDRLLRRAAPMEDGALAGAEGLAADVASVQMILLAVDHDVATANLPSCRTVRIVAKYLLRVHRFPPPMRAGFW